MAFNFGTANDNQKKAIQATDGPVLIIAGPGTGKTFTLVQRAVFLITEKGIKPENIMIATFTEKAAKELITRITNELLKLNINVNVNGDTIVSRDSDGALKVADTDEHGLTADIMDYGDSVSSGFKGTVRGIIEKTKGLFQLVNQNATAINEETARATTAEGQIAADVSAEAIRAQAAEQINANAIQDEAVRSQDVESDLSVRINAEEMRAKTAEQANTQAIEAEAIRAQAAEASKVDKIAGKGLSTEDYTTAEKTKLEGIEAGAQVNTVTSVAGRMGAVTLAKGDVGLGSVDNTADASKPVSTAQQTALNGKVDKVTGKQLSTEDYTTAEKSKLAGIQDRAEVNKVTSVAGRAGAVTLTKNDVGLGNADNTADSVKNVLSATRLTTARTISLTGAVTGSVSFNGSANVSIATNVGTIAASKITITQNANLGNATNLQAALNYIANVFGGAQKVTKIRAGTLDVDA